MVKFIIIKRIMQRNILNAERKEKNIYGDGIKIKDSSKLQLWDK